MTLLLATSGCTLKAPAPPPNGGAPVPLPTPSTPVPAPAPSLPGEATVPVGHVAGESFAAAAGDGANRADFATETRVARPGARFPSGNDDWVPRLLTALILFAVLGPLVLRTGGIRRRRRAG